MKLLLDTHIFLWSLLEPDHLTGRVVAEISDSSNEIWLSPISLWEVLVLAEKGRISLQPDPVRWLRNVLRTTPLREAPLNHEVAIQSRLIAVQRSDPVDRFLAATAVVYDLTLVTADERLLGSRQFSVLANR